MGWISPLIESELPRSHWGHRGIRGDCARLLVTAEQRNKWRNFCYRNIKHYSSFPFLSFLDKFSLRFFSVGLFVKYKSRSQPKSWPPNAMCASTRNPSHHGAENEIVHIQSNAFNWATNITPHIHGIIQNVKSCELCDLRREKLSTEPWARRSQSELDAPVAGQPWVRIN